MSRAESRTTTGPRAPHTARGRWLLAGAGVIGVLIALPASASSRDLGGQRDGAGQDRGSRATAAPSDASAAGEGFASGSRAGGARLEATRGREVAGAASWSTPPASGAGAQSDWGQGSDGQGGQTGDSGVSNTINQIWTQATSSSSASVGHGPSTWTPRSGTAASTAAAPAPVASQASAAPAPTSTASSAPPPASTSAPPASAPAASPAAASHGLGGAHRAQGGPAHAQQFASARGPRASGIPAGRGLSNRRGRGSITRAALGRTPAAHPAALRPVARPGHRAATGGPRSPLVRTVTKIIQVIPPPLRPAVGILGVLALALAAAAGLLLLRSRRLDRQRRRLAADVGLLESTLLPSLPERLGPAFVSTAYRPAEDLGAGGDFFDAFALSDSRTCLIVGDIAGHDRESILLTATVRYTLRAYLEAGLAPRVALAVASSVLGPRLAEQMATAVVAVYDGESGRLTYACAGHPAPILLGAELQSPTIGSSPLLGAGVPTGRRQVTLTLPPGASACFYTDGVIDPRIDGGRFGSQRLAQELAALGSEATAQDILLAVLAHSDEQTDDMTACVLRPSPESTVGPDDHLEEIELDGSSLARWGARFMAACGVAPAEVGGALERAREVIARCGTAVLTIRVADGASEARVDEPPSAVVPLTVHSLRRAPAALVAG
jgi:stage II sporulation SpoE-like protein